MNNLTDPSSASGGLRVTLAGLFCLAMLFCVGCGGQVGGGGPEGKIAGTYSGCATGAYVSGEGGASAFQTFIISFESLTQKDLAVVSWYIDWNTSFPESFCNVARSLGIIPMINWEPWLSSSNTLEAIATGVHDTYINTFALAAKSWGHRMFLRPMHEMNGNWYGWSGAANGSSPEAFIQAWKHIYGIFSGLGASNVTFVWSPNARSVPSDSWNEAAKYYPGTNYVDWIGIDGYSFGGSSGMPTYEAFDSIFAYAYSTFEGYSKPLMIAEFACGEGVDKPTWITDAFDNIKATQYQDIKAFIWFNKLKAGEPDWRVNSSAGALTNYRSAIGNAYFITAIP